MTSAGLCQVLFPQDGIARIHGKPGSDFLQGSDPYPIDHFDAEVKGVKNVSEKMSNLGISAGLLLSVPPGAFVETY